MMFLTTIAATVIMLLFVVWKTAGKDAFVTVLLTCLGMLLLRGLLT
jgi:hypothetical protein